MTDGREILSAVLAATQTTQTYLSNAMTRACSTSMKQVLAVQAETYDHLESEALRHAAQRGWDIPSAGFRRFPFYPYMRKKDSVIAQTLIRRYADLMISGMKCSSANESYDKQINELFQKLQYFQLSHIRQLLPFL